MPLFHRATSLRATGLFVAVLVLTTCLSTFGAARAQDATGTPSLPLSRQVGFSAPIFSQLEAEGQNLLGSSVAFSAYGRDYRLLAVWEFQEGLSLPVGGTALLFQLTTSEPILLWSRNYLEGWGQAPFISAYNGGEFHAPAPGDWNGDGTTEFAVFGSFAGTAWYSTMLYVYTLKSDNTVADALAGQLPPGNVATSAEMSYDGSALIAVLDVTGEMAMGLPNCCGPHISRFYTWKDGTLVDVSAGHVEKYTQPLGYAVYTVTTQPIADGAEFSARLLEILLMYQAIDQKDAGWTLVQDLVAQARQSGRLPEQTYVDKVFLPAMKQLYDAGQPFVVPDVTEPPPDFYAPPSNG